MAEYTPTMEQVRQAGVATYTYEQFDRWLNQVKAEAWDEGYSHCFDMERNGVDSVSKLDNPYREEQ